MASSENLPLFIIVAIIIIIIIIDILAIEIKFVLGIQRHKRADKKEKGHLSQHDSQQQQRTVGLRVRFID